MPFYVLTDRVKHLSVLLGLFFAYQLSAYAIISMTLQQSEELFARSGLSAALVVGDAFCLRSSGALGSESKNEQSDDVRQHAVEVGADAEVGEEENSVTVDIKARICCSNALEKTEQE